MSLKQNDHYMESLREAEEERYERQQREEWEQQLWEAQWRLWDMEEGDD